MRGREETTEEEEAEEGATEGEETEEGGKKDEDGTASELKT